MQMPMITPRITSFHCFRDNGSWLTMSISPEYAIIMIPAIVASSLMLSAIASRLKLPPANTRGIDEILDQHRSQPDNDQTDDNSA